MVLKRGAVREKTEINESFTDHEYKKLLFRKLAFLRLSIAPTLSSSPSSPSTHFSDRKTSTSSDPTISLSSLPFDSLLFRISILVNELDSIRLTDRLDLSFRHLVRNDSSLPATSLIVVGHRVDSRKLETFQLRSETLDG